MKKLMILSAVAVLSGVASAATFYDYKASVKYVDMKFVKVDSSLFPGIPAVKVIKKATLKGYVVTPANCGCISYEGSEDLPGDFSENTPTHGYLVVANKAAKSGAKVFPARLLVNAWATNAKKTTWSTEGYLFAGEGITPSIYGGQSGNAEYLDFGDSTTKWTDHLFGGFNEPTTNGNFVEAWMSHAGFGKAKSNTKGPAGCKIGSVDLCTDSLAGSVIGGLFLCTGNIYTEGFKCQGWQKTTDVISGTWSIKANNKLEAANLTAAEKAAIGESAEAEVLEAYANLKAAGEKVDKNFDVKEYIPTT